MEVIISIITGSLSLGLAGLLFWQMQRASAAADRHIEALKAQHKAERHSDALDVAISNRDSLISSLQRERDNLTAALTLTTEQVQDSILGHEPTEEEIADAVRAALRRAQLLKKEMPDRSATEDSDEDDSMFDSVTEVATIPRGHRGEVDP